MARKTGRTKSRVIRDAIRSLPNLKLAESEVIRQGFTIDRRDFTRYRPAKLGRFHTIP